MMATLPAFSLHPSWLEPLRDELGKPYVAELRSFLAEARRRRTVLPGEPDWFRALELTPLDRVKVVILGQDPYHGPGQAHGLCFSVLPHVRPPPSLANIFKELQNDLGIARPAHGFLEHWARQGVLLLNSVLTVEMGMAASHRSRGWEQLTDAIVRLVNAKPEPCVFMLWGNHAKAKSGLVDGTHHLVLEAPHPSPLSARTGFFGCRHFSRTNDFLESSGRTPIDWSLPDCSSKA